jgi:hypothetical protein
MVTRWGLGFLYIGEKKMARPERFELRSLLVLPDPEAVVLSLVLQSISCVLSPGRSSAIHSKPEIMLG